MSIVKLKSNTYYEIHYSELESLFREYYNIEIDLVDNIHIDYNSYYFTGLDLKKDDTEITESLINEFLTSDEFDVDRPDYVIWLLIMKDVLPEGNYIISFYG